MTHRPDVSFQVRAISYDLRKIRLAVLMGACVGVLRPVVKTLGAHFLTGFAMLTVLVMAVTIFLAATFRIKKNVLLIFRHSHGHIELGDRKVNDVALWRRLGHGAKLFCASGAIVITPLTADDPLDVTLRAAFGPPRDFVRRGGTLIRVSAVVAGMMGAVIVWLGFVYQITACAFGIILVIGGFAVFMTYSQEVPAPNGG